MMEGHLLNFPISCALNRGKKGSETNCPLFFQDIVPIGNVPCIPVPLLTQWSNFRNWKKDYKNSEESRDLMEYKD